MLNVLLLVMYLGITITSLIMFKNAFAAGIAKWCLGVGLLLIVVVFVLPMILKKKKFVDIVRVDFDRAFKLPYLQMFKACLVAILITQFVRVDIVNVNIKYYDSVDNMVMMSGDTSNEQLGEYLKAVAPFTPICVKDYITKRVDQTIAYISTNAFIESVSSDDMNEEMEAMVSYANDRYVEAESETDVAKNTIVSQVVYILLYFVIDMIRDVAIKNQDNKNKDDSEKKRDIFEGVNLMGD